MTSPMNTRNVATLSVIAATAMMVIAGSVWAKGHGLRSAMAMEETRIDIAALHTATEVANLPIVYVVDAF
jgi:hypothetical protein